MQMAFYEGDLFPTEYRADAFVAMRGSWNRRPPSGYEVMRVDFENGKPVGFEHFLEGFLIRRENGGYGHLARLAGLAVGPDGALYVGDDAAGVIYRVTHTPSSETTAAVPAFDTPNAVAEPQASEIALKLVEASTDAAIAVSSDFAAGNAIPMAHAADGDNASPKLEWSGAPRETKSFAIIMDDPDAVNPKPFVHWIVYDLPGNVTALREGLSTEPSLSDPKAAKQGTNSLGATGYFGPKPPAEDPAHHYHFQIFALDVPSLQLDPGAKREDILKAMEGHVIAKGEIVGTFKRPPA